MNSCLSYEVKFVLKFTEGFTGTSTTRTGNGYGRYYVKNNILYYQPLIAASVASGVPTYSSPAKLGDPKAIALWPMNACCILDKTVYTAAGNSYEDEHVNRLR